jgi:hypothetical protein
MNMDIDCGSGNEKPGREGLLGGEIKLKVKLGRSYKANSRATELDSSKQGTDRHKLTGSRGGSGAEIDTFLSEMRLSAQFYVTL